ncbi:uncharacterized protein V1510DRAFT_422305 [Dipodascopsis tothii]|uniref:uncharacterized protein n=1 Tax=Dipodascopsis tothii TaxID=44089 RepID=UPI0034D01FD6
MLRWRHGSGRRRLRGDSSRSRHRSSHRRRRGDRNRCRWRYRRGCHRRLGRHRQRVLARPTLLTWHARPIQRSRRCALSRPGRPVSLAAGLAASLRRRRAWLRLGREGVVKRVRAHRLGSLAMSLPGLLLVQGNVIDPRGLHHVLDQLGGTGRKAARGQVLVGRIRRHLTYICIWRRTHIVAGIVAITGIGAVNGGGRADAGADGQRGGRSGQGRRRPECQGVVATGGVVWSYRGRQIRGGCGGRGDAHSVDKGHTGVH